MSLRNWNTFQVKTLIYNGAKEGTKKCAEHLLEEAKRRVPVDTGALKISGEMRETPSGYIVSFEGDDNGYDYAVIQHQIPMHHPKGGTDHYLQNPAEENSEMYKRWIAEAVGDKL